MSATFPRVKTRGYPQKEPPALRSLVSPATQEEWRTLRSLESRRPRLRPKRKGERCASQESRRLACETLGVGNFLECKILPPPAQPPPARRLLSRLRRGGDCCTKLPTPAQPTQARTPAFLAFAAGATAAIYTTANTTDAGEDACFLCFAERLKAMARLRRGGDCRNKYHRLHNRRRRGRLRSLLCRAPKGGSQAALRGRLLHEITDAFL